MKLIRLIGHVGLILVAVGCAPSTEFVEVQLPDGVDAQLEGDWFDAEGRLYMVLARGPDGVFLRLPAPPPPHRVEILAVELRPAGLWLQSEHSYAGEVTIVEHLTVPGVDGLAGVKVSWSSTDFGTGAAQGTLFPTRPPSAMARSFRKTANERRDQVIEWISRKL